MQMLSLESGFSLCKMKRGVVGPEKNQRSFWQDDISNDLVIVDQLCL